MNHYVVINEYTVGGKQAIRILAVTEAFSEAMAYYNQYVKLERQTVVDEDWYIYQDDIECFDAGEVNNWLGHHTRVFVVKEKQEVEI